MNPNLANETPVAANKEQLILEAAEHEFLTKGYDGARTAAIAKAAGVTHAMLNYYFRTKEQLFERFIKKKMDEAIHLVSHLVENNEVNIVKRLELAVAEHFDFVKANPDLPRFLINEVLPYGDRCKIFVSRVREITTPISVLQKEVDDAVSRGEIEQFDVFLLFQSILSLNLFPSFLINILKIGVAGAALDEDEYFAARKAENVELVMRRIKKVR
ncbi:MAG: TetR/AcrR family transcriptional regulator [Candidatus Cryptobacteroides sp.]